tara:strand:+ start:442 stop:702 length:261 start_codon:yes stop_codon:yes gene_type:complete
LFRVLRSCSVHLNLRRGAISEEAVLRRSDRSSGRGIAGAAPTIVVVIIVVAVIIIIVFVIVIVVSATRTVPPAVVIVACENERHIL